MKNKNLIHKAKSFLELCYRELNKQHLFDNRWLEVQSEIIKNTQAQLKVLTDERERVDKPGFFDTKEEKELNKKIANAEYMLRIQEHELKRLNTSFSNLTGSVGFDYET